MVIIYYRFKICLDFDEDLDDDNLNWVIKAKKKKYFFKNIH